MPGPAPTPTALKKLRGNPGKRPLNKREPMPPVPGKVPSPPTRLTKEAKKEWRRVAKHLVNSRVLTEVDLTALEAYCSCFALWIAATGKVAETGPVVKTTNGNFVQNPYLSVANRMMKEMRSWMGELGMTPASRSRVQMAGDTEQATLADELFALVGEVVVNADEAQGD